MTFGKMNKINNHYKKVLALLIFLFSIPASALESNIELPELLKQFARQQQSTVDFNEEKYTSFLKQPIKSSGNLQFIAPDKLNKFIKEPEEISHKITGNELEIKHNKKTHVISLNDHPEFSIILRSIISLLSGNHEALRKDFKISFESKASTWTIILTPHDSYISEYVESIKMFGDKNKLTKIIVTEPNNDHSITHIYNHR